MWSAAKASMPDDPIPEDVRRLLSRHFGSLSELEVFIVLVRDQRVWQPADIGRQMVINTDHARLMLEALARTPLVSNDGSGYVFSPKRGKDREAAELIPSLYETYRLRIMDIVLSRPSDQVQDFADAFRVRSDADDEEL